MQTSDEWSSIGTRVPQNATAMQLIAVPSMKWAAAEGWELEQDWLNISVAYSDLGFNMAIGWKVDGPCDLGVCSTIKVVQPCLSGIAICH